MQTEKTSPKFARAFALGCGGTATGGEELLPGPVALFGSPARWAMLQQAQAEGRDWYYGDHAFYKRGRYYRITKNAYQYIPTTGAIARAKPDRFRATGVEMCPHWQRDGASIVVCPNSPRYMAQFGIDANAWVLNAVQVLGSVTDRPIVIRWKTQAQRRPLYVDLHQAWMTVVFSSASAVESLVAGVPVCVLAPWCTTASMGIQDLALVESPIYPDHREQFLYALADRQWTLAEMEAGMAWKALNAKQV